MKKLVIGLSLAFLLTGCQVISSNIEASQDDAYEVALDDSNVLSTEVISYDISDSKGSYHISFSTQSGFYEYVIGHDGIIQNKEYTAGAQSAPVEDNQTEVEPEKEEDEFVLDDAAKDAALQSACSYYVISPSHVTNTSVQMDGDVIEVRFTYDNVTYVSTVNPVVYNVINTYTE